MTDERGRVEVREGDRNPHGVTYFAQRAAVGGGESSPIVIMNIVMTTVAISPAISPVSMLTMMCDTRRRADAGYL